MELRSEKDSTVRFPAALILDIIENAIERPL